MVDAQVFVLEQMKIQAGIQLRDRVEKHIKNEFYNKILPKILKEVDTNLKIEVVNNNDYLEIKIKVNQPTTGE